MKHIVTNLINVALLNYWAKKRKNRLNKQKIRNERNTQKERRKNQMKRNEWKREKMFQTKK